MFVFMKALTLAHMYLARVKQFPLVIKKRSLYY